MFHYDSGESLQTRAGSGPARFLVSFSWFFAHLFDHFYFFATPINHPRFDSSIRFELSTEILPNVEVTTILPGS